MQQIAIICVLSSAAIVFVLGLTHLALTLFTDKFHPREQSLLPLLQQVSPVLTRQTSMWRAWVGFNASHSMGAMFFGLMFGYLALCEPAVLMHSVFLQGIGLIVLLSYVVLAHRYWFKIPLRGCIAASLLFFAALVIWHQ